MDVPKLVRLNEPILHKRASPVDPKDIGQPWFQNELDILVRAMRSYQGVGIAASQIGVDKKIFALEIKENARYPDALPIPLQIYINPVIKKYSSEQLVFQEGCLSVPSLRGDVPRSAEITLAAMDREGNEVTVKADGFLARIIQHECDHLNGLIFLQRVEDHGTVVRWKKRKA